MAQIKIWCFEEAKAEAAAKEFAEKIAADEGGGDEDAAAVIEEIILEFLNSQAALNHGLVKEFGA